MPTCLILLLSHLTLAHIDIKVNIVQQIWQESFSLNCINCIQKIIGIWRRLTSERDVFSLFNTNDPVISRCPLFLINSIKHSHSCSSSSTFVAVRIITFWHLIYDMKLETQLPEIPPSDTNQDITAMQASEFLNISSLKIYLPVLESLFT